MKVKTMNMFVIQSIVRDDRYENGIKSIVDEDFVNWSGSSTEEEDKKKAKEILKVKRETFIDEEFRLILREEYEEVVE
jgi:hypothetical protein